MSEEIKNEEEHSEETVNTTEEQSTENQESSQDETSTEDSHDETATEEVEQEIPLEEQEIAPNDWDDIEDPAELKAMLSGRADEARDYLEKLKRLKAEYNNYQNRMIRERDRISQFAIQELAKDVFTVLDNFSMALENIDKIEVPETMVDFVKGIDMTKDELFKVLEKRGVEEIKAEGETFDPVFMEALTTMPGEIDNQVIQVFRKGYKIGDRALRPAQVIVSKATGQES